KKLLEIHAPKDVHKVMKDQSRLVSSAYNGEKKLYKVQTRYAQLSQSIDWLRVGFYLHKRFGKGLRFVLDHTTPNSPFKIEVLKALIEDNYFDYYKGYATYMPDYQSPYTYKHYTFAPFPKEVYQFTQLQGISIKGCRIAEVPAGIHRLTNLEVLDLSGNFLKVLPEDITQLKNLRKINISDNEFEEFPLLLTQLPSLEEIKITYNRKRWEHNPLPIPDGVYKALPNCSIQTR
ncbi:MAG: leucine-rich repeat domain-containing protein, partial [Bacteroidota bacterium]